MLIETRTLGRKARPLDGWTIPEPPIDRDGDGDALTPWCAREDTEIRDPNILEWIRAARGQ